MTYQPPPHNRLRHTVATGCLLVAGLSYRGSLAELSATSPGVAFDQLPIDSSGIVVSADVPLWKQRLFLRSYAEQLGTSPDTAGSGSGHNIIDTVVETESVSSRQAQTPYRSESAGDLLAGIRSAFSLQIKELAEILKVERPTIYAWMKGSASPQQHNRLRLRDIHRLAMQWNRLSNRPTGTAIRETDAAGRSVVDYLKEDIPPREIIVGRLKAIADETQARDASRRPVLAELAKKHGIALTAIREQVEEFDILTGKPFTLE
jgi:hypothetical protein